MGSRPKKSDYQASEAEKTSAAVGKAEYEYFKQNYAPLLRQMRDSVDSDDSGKILRGRANADTMQTLSNTTYEGSQNVDRSGDTASALLGQYGVADQSATDIRNKKATNVLGTARGQVADAQTGLAQASRMATSTALDRAKNRQDVAQAKLNAAVDIGSTLVTQGIKNKRTGGSLFSPGNYAQSLDAPNPTARGAVKPDGSLANRLNWAFGG